MLLTMPARRTATLLALAATVATASVSQAVKVHSYTFNDSTANDSIGTAHGTLVDPSGIAFYQGGQLRLTENNNANSNQDFSLPETVGAYVDLPNYIISDAAFFGTSGQLSLEFWATTQQNRNWARLGDFGNSIGGEDFSTGGGTSEYIIVVPQTGRAGNTFATSTHQPDGLGGGLENFVEGTGPLSVGEEHHVVVTLDQVDTSVNPNGTLSLYLNGALVSSGPVVGDGNDVPFDAGLMNDVNNWLGRAQWPDPLFDGSYNEFNVYDHALSATEVSDAFAAGPVASEAIPTLIVDRATGEMTLTNLEGDSLSLAGYNISSAAGALDSAGWTSINAGGTFDPNGNWVASSTTAELIAEADGGDGGDLSSGEEASIGAAWSPSRIEDVAFNFTLVGGTEMIGEVQYVNVDGGYARSDLDADGDVDADDFAAFVANSGADLSGLSLYESAVSGDLDGDGDNDYRDFRLFKADFIAANGSVAFAALSGAAAPEPAAATLALLVTGVVAGVRRRR
ncbi:hypothetical protein Pla123a_22470 [Posidoniimonas polymericola]|uniref:LamG-like jellyroll fold domain-containing protein n=1 Tax=Posidoniimonas polymericola TaxID=2528002 RepID=A0A5C5YPI2_9BACT|nr:LamG domain-containing protein [Posidoniimonas polymericola]TWT76824.1 hypothetical protein Pla123a_22470 [Posidoniimonas polymericola]